MTAKELLLPRFEVIASWPDREDYGVKVGDVIQLENYLDGDKKPRWKLKNCEYYAPFFEEFPHLFRKLEWWENRSVLDMPKKIKTQMFDENNVYEIEQWDMGKMFGYVSVAEKSGCGLTGFKTGYGYLPVD